MLKLLETTKTVLGRNRLPYDHVEAIEAKMRESKARIDAMLGLSEANLYRAKVSLDKTESTVRTECKLTTAAIAHILKEAINSGAPIDLSTLSITKNSVTVKGQTQRLSKVLAKYLPNQENAVQSCMKELGITRPEQFLPKLGDIVKSGVAVFVSTNILDFLTASDNASFRSCHSMDGVHYNGNIAYTRDKMTVLTYTADSSIKETQHEIYKNGRSWLFIADGKIVQPRSYGAYNNAERQAARNFILERMAKETGVDLSAYSVTNTSYNSSFYSAEVPQDKNPNHNMAGYFDASGIELVHLKNSKELPHLDFAASTCLVCGITTNYPKKGVCSEHDGKVRYTCAGCGERHLIDSCVTVNGQHYCPNCYTNTFAQCGHCSNHFEKDKIQTIDGVRVCPECLKKNYTACVSCGGFHQKDKMQKLQGVKGHVCNECLDKFLLCSICGDYHPASAVNYHKYVGRVCGKCLDKVAVRCEGCGEYFTKEDLSKKYDNNSVCLACAAAVDGQVYEVKIKPKYAGLPEGWDDFMEEVG